MALDVTGTPALNSRVAPLLTQATDDGKIDACGRCSPVLADGSLVEGDGAEAAVSSYVSCCAPGWPNMWVILVLDTVNTIVVTLSLPDAAARYFNGGTDPCANKASESAACKQALDKFAAVAGLFGLFSAVLSFVVAPAIGVASDRFGPKILIMASVFAKFITGMFFLAFVFERTSIYPLMLSTELIALVPSKLTFGLWIVERTAPEHRAVVFARLGAALGLEGVVAPLAAVLLTPKRAATLVVAFGSVVLIVAAFCLRGLPRGSVHGSLSGAPRLPLSQQLRALVRLLALPKYRLILTLAFIGGGIEHGFFAVWLLYLKSSFGLTMQTAAPIFSVTALSSLAVQLCLTKFMQRRFGLRGVIIVAVCSGIITCVGYLIAPSSFVLTLVVAVSGFGSLADPAVSAVVTNMATTDGGDVGAALGIAFSIGAISAIVGPLLCRILFAYVAAGAPLVFAIAMNCLSLALLWRAPADMFSAA